MYVYTIYIHGFLLYFYYTQTLLPSHTFYTSFPFLKHFSVAAVTIPVILLYSLPLEVGPVFSDSMIPFLPFRESHCVNFVVMFTVGPVFPLSQPTLSQQIPNVRDQLWSQKSLKSHIYQSGPLMILRRSQGPLFPNYGCHLLTSVP